MARPEQTGHFYVALGRREPSPLEVGLMNASTSIVELMITSLENAYRLLFSTLMVEC